MKAVKKEIAIFIFISLFIVIGAASFSFPKLFVGRPYRIIRREESITEAIQIVNSEINTRLRYHDYLMDAESVITRLTGTKRIEKEDGEIVAIAKNDMLSGASGELTNDEISGAVRKISQLKTVSEKNGADFLYIYAPEKNLDLELPASVDNYSVSNYNVFLKNLKEYNIPVLDLYAEKENEGISVEEMFFATDHHWKPESGFWATEKICRELSDLYGFDYNKYYTNINNYNVKLYEKWFLGSQGKKVGTYFSPKSPDDISLITPKFETSISESQPFKEETRNGDFSQTVLYMENIECKDYYNLNSYAVYSGGDFRLQITKNNLAPNNSKILIVRDSFACAVTPFLTLNCKELHTVDMRDYDYYIGDKLNLKDYINQIKPDYVIVLYTGAGSSTDSRYDFF
ncbi:MAG: hypothetical protein IJS03_00125 [Eubacterium sp.]|nr:hypothetical protein [Eubacterium sp.]